MKHPAKPLKASRIRPVERPERRTGIETATTEQTAPKARLSLKSPLQNLLKACYLLANGWVPTDLGLWQKRTRLPVGFMTETYNLATAYRTEKDRL